MEPWILRASGSKQDLDTLYSQLVCDNENRVGLYEVVRETFTLMAAWDFDYVPDGWIGRFICAEQVEEISQQLPGLRLAVTWRHDRPPVVEYSVYAAGIMELYVYDEPIEQRHADRLWKRANAIAEGHLMQLTGLPG